METLSEYPPGTVVRVIRSGVFALILRRCYCGNAFTMPVHYEAKFEDGNISIVKHADVELECLPVGESE